MYWILYNGAFVKSIVSVYWYVLLVGDEAGGVVLGTNLLVK